MTALVDRLRILTLAHVERDVMVATVLYDPVQHGRLVDEVLPQDAHRREGLITPHLAGHEEPAIGVGVRNVDRADVTQGPFGRVRSGAPLIAGLIARSGAEWNQPDASEIVLNYSLGRDHVVFLLMGFRIIIPHR